MQSLFGKRSRLPEKYTTSIQQKPSYEIKTNTAKKLNIPFYISSLSMILMQC